MEKHIKDLFKKFLKIGEGLEIIKNIFIESLYLEVGVKISPDKIKIKNGKVKIEASSGLKNEIFLKKEKIIKRFNSLSNEKIYFID